MIDEDFQKLELTYNMLGYPFSERFVGVGLVTEINKEKWRKRRTLFNHGFKKDVLSECVSEFNAKGSLLIQKLNSLCHSKDSICLFNELSRVTLDAIAKVTFTYKIEQILAFLF